MSTAKFYIKRNDLQPYYTARLAGKNSTTLSSQATYNDTTLTISTTDGFPTTGTILLFDYVSIAYTGKSTTTFTGLTWTGGATAQVFAIGTVVQEIIDLTGATVRFTMASTEGTIKVNRATANITNAKLGDVEYRWATSDVNTTGTYLAEFEVSPPSSPKFTVPTSPSDKAIVIIVADLDAI